MKSIRVETSADGLEHEHDEQIALSAQVAADALREAVDRILSRHGEDPGDSYLWVGYETPSGVGVSLPVEQDRARSVPPMFTAALAFAIAEVEARYGPRPGGELAQFAEALMRITPSAAAALLQGQDRLASAVLIARLDDGRSTIAASSPLSPVDPRQMAALLREAADRLDEAGVDVIGGPL